MIYLDWAATAVPRSDLIGEANRLALQHYGNPSSIHAHGIVAENLIRKAREELSLLLKCKPSELIFTSGGTEANNKILNSVLRFLQNPRFKSNPKKIIVTGIEHPSVYNPALNLARYGFETEIINPGKSGIIETKNIEEKLTNDTVLVSAMLINNETGAIQPVKKISCMIAAYKKNSGRRTIFHTDAVQAFGKVPFHPHELGVDAATISAHKVGGPKGTGVLFLRENLLPEFIYSGGDQELGRRPGTENVAGILGMQLAASAQAASSQADHTRISALADLVLESLSRIEGSILIPSTRMEKRDDYSPYIIKASFPPIPGEVIVRALDEQGIMISTGSACHARSEKRLRVLENMGIKREAAKSSIRISLGHSTTEAEINRTMQVLDRVISGLRKTM
ncbi:MAG: cysteine desulfurase [Spirochaetales bacterium]|nr:cysteine desulfurase [Spirochaetales bacterium]